ncbi:MAG: metal-dependent hydrolase [Nanoarchaeota archaeon]|nr:metal-dependent hydrolase [Nanoarchaeota archaeon]
MYPQTHFLFPFFIGLVLSKLNVLSWELALLAGIIGVLVDLDHYVEHILHAKMNQFSLRATWNNSIKLHRFYQRSFIHFEKGALLVTGVLVALAFFSWQVSLALAFGYYSHLLLDYPSMKKERRIHLRIGHLYIREPYMEIALDVLLMVGVLLLVL